MRNAQKKIQRNQQILEEYKQKYFCENSPSDQHDFQPYQPFLGCFKRVCKFCLQESASKNLQQSTNAHRGKRFGSEKRKKR